MSRTRLSFLEVCVRMELLLIALRMYKLVVLDDILQPKIPTTITLNNLKRTKTQLFNINNFNLKNCAVYPSWYWWIDKELNTTSVIGFDANNHQIYNHKRLSTVIRVMYVNVDINK